MIRNFVGKAAQDIFDGVNSKQARKVPNNLHGKVSRLFDQLNAVVDIEDMRSPPGNMLELLSGNLSGFWSVRVNKQWRVIFGWDEESREAFDVDIVDYH